MESRARMYDLTSPFEAVIEGNGRLILVLDVPGGGVRGGVGGVRNVCLSGW